MNTYLTNIEKTLQGKFAQRLVDVAKTVASINPWIKVATNAKDIDNIISLRQQVYPECYPESDVTTLDAYDLNSILFFVEDTQGQVVGTCRLVLDTELGFLEEETYQPFISKLRHQNKVLAEWGRCVVKDDCSVRAFDFADMLRELATYLQIEYILIFNRQCDLPRVLDRLDAEILTETNKTFGSSHKFTAVLWSIQNTIYNPTLWDNYSRSFLTVTTRYQIELLIEACHYLTGRVIDCGSGCAKIAPYLALNQNIVSYTAIDASPTMCRLGRQVIKKLNKGNFSIEESYIEHWQVDERYDSAVSINSLYSWSNPHKVLQHIHSMLQTDGVFVLASINHKINIPLLIKNTQADLLMHPDYEVFCDVNIHIDNNAEAHRYSLDEMIQLVHNIGFEVMQCHDKLFENGLNFMVLRKS